MSLNAGINSTIAVKWICIMKMHTTHLLTLRATHKNFEICMIDKNSELEQNDNAMLKLINCMSKCGGLFNHQLCEMNHIYTRYPIFSATEFWAHYSCAECFMFTWFLYALSSLNFLCRICICRLETWLIWNKKYVYLAYNSNCFFPLALILSLATS